MSKCHIVGKHIAMLVFKVQASRFARFWYLSRIRTVKAQPRRQQSLIRDVLLAQTMYGCKAKLRSKYSHLAIDALGTCSYAYNLKLKMTNRISISTDTSCNYQDQFLFSFLLK